MADGIGDDLDLVPEAALILVDGGDRRWNSAAVEMMIGVVRLAGWQVHPIYSPDSFHGQDSYLIKLNYELALEPEVPAPPWFEVGFGLSDSTTKEPVAIVDALPRAIFQPCGPAGYEVSTYLNFTPAPGATAAPVALPPLNPFIDVFGVGRPEPIRWRYMSPGTDGTSRGVRPGSYVSWIIAAVPAGCAELSGQFTARYDMDPDDALGCLPCTRSSEFTFALTTRPQSPVAPRRLDLDAPAGRRPPRIFISYAHDNEGHIESVRAFAEFLAGQCGFDVHLDRWDLDRRRNWYLWAIEQVQQADFVIIVASPMCRQVGDGTIESSRHRGLQTELGLIQEKLHTDRPLWVPKLLPVVLPGGSADDIPLFLQPQILDHFMVENLTIGAAEDLIRTITGQPPFQRPATGRAPGLGRLPQ